MKEFITKAELARRTHVSASTVTRSLDSDLKPAVHGNRIDFNHPCVAEFARNHGAGKTVEPATGIHHRYEEALEFCRSSGKFSANAIKKNLGVGSGTAKKLIDQITAAGFGPDKPPPKKVVAPPPPPAEPAAATKVPHERGYTVRNQKKKAASLENIKSGGSMPHQLPDNLSDYADMTIRQVIENFGNEAAFVDFLKSLKEIQNVKEKELKNAATEGRLVNRHLIKTGILEPLDAAFLTMLRDGSKTIAVRAMAMAHAGRDETDLKEFVADTLTSFIQPAKDKMVKAIKNVES